MRECHCQLSWMTFDLEHEAWLVSHETFLTVEEQYSDVIMSAMASQITGVSIVCPTACSGANQRKRQSPASLAFVRGIYRWPVARKKFPFDDVIMNYVILVAFKSAHSIALNNIGIQCLRLSMNTLGDFESFSSIATDWKRDEFATFSRNFITCHAEFF